MQEVRKLLLGRAALRETEKFRFQVIFPGILNAYLFGSHAVFKYGFAVQTNPGVGGAGNGNFNIWIGCISL